MQYETDGAWPSRFGVFLQPLNDPASDTTAALEQYLQLMELLDNLGYDEAWIGEHHSGGWEIIGAPDIFIATAAERTRHIMLGTGVTSVTYHHPLIVADRMALLDHLTRGRVMFGMGPGALVTDAWMFGIDPVMQRSRMQEFIDVVVPLLKGETISRETDWFTLNEAHLQVMPYSNPCFEIAVAGAYSPSGARLAGRYGLGLLSVSATTAQTSKVLTNHWDVWQDEAGQYGNVADRSRWRMCGAMHLAETEEQARKDVKYGIDKWGEYFSKTAPVPFADNSGTTDEFIDALIASGYAVIGTPDQAISRLKELAETSGGFGSFLVIDSDWASPDRKRESYELFARYVVPAFRRNCQSRVRSADWIGRKAPELISQAMEARKKAFSDYDTAKAERAADAGR